MHTYYPYKFEYQPRVHLCTPSHSQYQDQIQRHEVQVHQLQNQQVTSPQQHLHQPASTPGTTIDTPMTCPNAVASSSSSSSMSYFTPLPQPELVFTDPLIRPHGVNTPDAATSLNGPEGDAMPTEQYYSYDHSYEWGTEQSPHQQQQQHIQSHPPQPPSALSTYSPSQPTPPSLPPQIRIPQPQSQSPSQPQRQFQSSHEPSPETPHIPPSRLTHPVRREREQLFRAFHPYANARPSATGEKGKEKGKGKDEDLADAEKETLSGPSSVSTITNSSPPSTSPVSTTPLPPTHHHKSGRTAISITIADPAPPHVTTPAPTFGLFGSYPLSRGQALPGPTGAPETSSSVMRLVLAPGALTPNGCTTTTSRHGGKREKGEKSTGNVVNFLGAVPAPGPVTTTNSAFLANSGNLNLSLGTTTTTTITTTSSGTCALNNFNTPTPGLSAAPSSSNPTVMAMRKPRMACYFCRKRKIACGPGPEAIALAEQAQAQVAALAQAQTQVQPPQATQLEQQEQEHGHGHKQQMGELPSETTMSAGDSSVSLAVNAVSSTSPSTSSLSVSVSPMISSLTPNQLLSQPSLQTLTGDEGPCNQCARRDLKCERPTESKRGVRKGKSKKEKEREAREKEAKERELKKGECKERKKDDKERSDEEGDGDVDEEMIEDVDMDGDGETDPEIGDENDGEVLEMVPSTSATVDPTLSQPPLPSPTDSKPSVVPLPLPLSIAPSKPPNRGRGRPPKHLAHATSESSQAFFITHANSGTGSKGGMKSMTGSFKWTNSTAGNKNKAQTKSKGKGKGKGKKNADLETDVDVVEDLVPAASVLKSEDDLTDSRMEDVQEPSHDSQRSGVVVSGDGMEDDNVQRGGADEEGIDEIRNDVNESDFHIDAEGHSSPTSTSAPTFAVATSDMQTQTQAQHLPSLPHPYPHESSLSPLVPSDFQNPDNVISLPPDDNAHSDVTAPTSVQLTVTVPPYSGPHPYYSHGHQYRHEHYPAINQQHHSHQHEYAVPEENNIESSDANPSTSSYTAADMTILQQGGNDEGYHSHHHIQHVVSPALNSHAHDGLYIIAYPSPMLPQTHAHEQGSMPVAQSDLDGSMGMHLYYGSGIHPATTDPYDTTAVEYEQEASPYDLGLQQQQQQQQQIPMSVNAETYDLYASDGYAMDSTSDIRYDRRDTQAQAQGYVGTALGTDYQSYGYAYGYGKGYAL